MGFVLFGIWSFQGCIFSSFLWVMTFYSVVAGYQTLRGTCDVYLRCKDGYWYIWKNKMSKIEVFLGGGMLHCANWKVGADVSKDCSVFILKTQVLKGKKNSLTLQIATVRTFRTSVNNGHSTQSLVLEAVIFQLYCCEKLKSWILNVVTISVKYTFFSNSEILNEFLKALMFLFKC